MKQLAKKIMILSVLLMFAGVCSAETVQFEATETADNYYAIYTGSPQRLTFVGKHLSDSFCAAGIFTFDVKPGDYIYVAAWNSVNTSPGKGLKA